MKSPGKKSDELVGLQILQHLLKIPGKPLPNLRSEKGAEDSYNILPLAGKNITAPCSTTIIRKRITELPVPCVLIIPP